MRNLLRTGSSSFVLFDCLGVYGDLQEPLFKMEVTVWERLTALEAHILDDY